MYKRKNHINQAIQKQGKGTILKQRNYFFCIDGLLQAVSKEMLADCLQTELLHYKNDF